MLEFGLREKKYIFMFFVDLKKSQHTEIELGGRIEGIRDRIRARLFAFSTNLTPKLGLIYCLLC